MTQRVACRWPPLFHRRLRRPGHRGEDEGALVRLWREKRGEVEPEDLSGIWRFS